MNNSRLCSCKLSHLCLLSQWRALWKTTFSIHSLLCVCVQFLQREAEAAAREVMAEKGEYKQRTKACINFCLCSQVNGSTWTLDCNILQLQQLPLEY